MVDNNMINNLYPDNLNSDLAKQIYPFAQVSSNVLQKLGGDYATFAKQIIGVEGSSILQEFAGNYIWAVKENGIWKEQLEGLLITRYLLISPQGEVQFGSQLDVVTIQNLSVKGQTLSWTFDDNESAASITFKINSEDNYFWEQHQTGKLFEGSLEYPNQDRKYFRGRFEVVVLPPLRQFKVKTIILIDDSINPQSFDFQVAVIKANQSSQSNGNNILEQINEAVFKTLVNPMYSNLIEPFYKNKYIEINTDDYLAPFTLPKFLVESGDYFLICNISKLPIVFNISKTSDERRKCYTCW